MSIARIEVSKVRFNLRAGELKIVAWVKSCLGLKIVKSGKDGRKELQFEPQIVEINCSDQKI
ncbi:hypothetical protein TSAR_009851 [Trichomalopsis sarcophagae]|uniref:Uncharacterized protein n=1 Tax=Trichomalopsis sarcophagae TaxID=543379 RepID=A0A232ERQ7_9HYME|nr:hypothetical protein TSAR_009851 [Trichomalopsis sarcophagae]